MTTTPINFDEIQVAAPPLPHNREAEEAVIGAVLISPHCLYELSPFLNAADFYIIRLRWIWETFLALDGRRSVIDLLTVSSDLARRGLLEDVGGQAYLIALLNQVPTTLHAVNYGHLVAECAVRRQAIAAAEKIAQLAYDTTRPIEKCVAESIAEIRALETLRDEGHFISMGDLLSETYDDICERSNDPKDVWGLATGLPTFDRMTGGVQIGELTYIVGGPGIGKTWLELGWAMELGKQMPGAVVSLEMRKRSIGRRLMSGMSGVSTRAMKSGYVTETDWPLLLETLDQYQGYPVWIDDSSYDTDRLRAVLAALKQKRGIRWFFLDYALLLMDEGRDEIEQTKRISANLKRMVHDLDLAGVILHSVTKIGMDGGEPKMSDQRGSGQAIHDADLQLFLTQLHEGDDILLGLPPADRKRMATLWCTKGRDLEQSKFKVHLTRRGNSPFWGEFSTGREK